MYKGNKNNFFFVIWARRGLIIAPTYLYVNGELGSRSSLESFRNCWFDIFYFLIILKTFLCFLIFLIIWNWVLHDASGQTDTKIKQRKQFLLSLFLYISFDIFSRKINLKIRVTRHEQSDGH